MTKDFKYIKSFAKAQMDDTGKGSRLWKKLNIPGYDTKFCDECRCCNYISHGDAVNQI